MRIDIITALPSLLESPLNDSIVKRAQTKGHVEINVHDLRDYSTDKHRNIDDYAFGGGAGMVMNIEPIARCIDKLQSERTYDEVIYMTPDGKTLNQQLANTLSIRKNLIILCGHYKGVDERVREKYITLEISIGDYVLSGGELAAAVLADAVIRLVPGVLNDETSALTDSFQDDLLAPPVYTRPAEFDGMKVPDVLISGNGKAIETWRMEKAMERTRNRRPDLWEKFNENQG
ncbi:tRNA (guanosine(37)-N1)-methyltransferase TrmD [Cryomorpha ignava]|uniref:tRNA (guanine-N(1)-)-methyltransferase n=1 Tax=Cryomorpha ignava TaxID=101383 RepID=A0A7K3WL13_9FLAO|nr:tRNA (guanosine(37)-N1)-methyltransferase TrmD [Cryomorpha ignava]NEN22184.1 tRNA (guanosine(37)-N1)-methyltransferase TrmD [Cryomorpha ignava]